MDHWLVGFASQVCVPYVHQPFWGIMKWVTVDECAFLIRWWHWQELSTPTRSKPEKQKTQADEPKM